MNEKELKELLEKLGSSIDEKLKKATESLSVKLSDEEKKSLMDSFKKELEPEMAKYVKMQEQLDALDVKMQRLPKGITGKSFSEDFADKIKEALGDNKNIRNIKGHAFEFERKLDDMTEANSFESTVVVPVDQRSGIVYNPLRRARIRDIISSGITGSNTVSFVREYAITSNTALTSEGAEYKQEDFDLKRIDALVLKVTNYIIVSEEMLEDVPGLTSYITARLPEKIKNLEDTEILRHATYGILSLATSYVDVLADSKVQRIDVLTAACNQVKVAEYGPTAILLHPNDAMKMKLTKDDNGQYIFPWVFMNNGVAVDSIPVIESTAMTEGSFLVGDFKLGAQIFDRRQMSIEFANTNEDNFIKGMVTVRGSERIAIAVYRPSAFVYGTFASALAKGSA